MEIDPELAKVQTLPPERLAEIQLAPQPTIDRRLGVSVKDVLNWLEGRPHMGNPRTVSTTIRHIAAAMAETLDQDQRDAIVRPLLPLMLGTNDGVELQRIHGGVNWLTHTCLPTWLELAGRHHQAAKLRGLPLLSGKPSRNYCAPASNALSEIAITFDDPTRNMDDHIYNAVAASGFHSVCISTHRIPLPKMPQVALAAAKTAANTGRALTPTVLELQAKWTELVQTLINIR